MSERPQGHAATRPNWLTLEPESWRDDLLRIALRVLAVLGTVVCVPSVYLALKAGLVGVVMLDAMALAAVYALTLVTRIPIRVRAACCCLVLYALGAGLMVTVGSISQIYLFGFSLFTTLMISGRWGLASVALNAATMLAIGFVGVAAADLMVPRWPVTYAAWTVITTNFVLVNGSLVVTINAVLAALESALARSVGAREALEYEQNALLQLNESLALEVQERFRTEQALRQSKALLRIAGLTARLGGWQVALADDRVTWSDETCELVEVPIGTRPTIEEALAFYAPEYRDQVRASFEQCSRTGDPVDLEAEIITPRGSRLWVRLIGSVMRNAEGTITHVHGSMQDVTARKQAEARHQKLEAQLQQSQKLETIGSLAGGVAHDFNNLLSVVLSYSEMLISSLKPGDPMRSDLVEIRTAGQRATELTRQLLAFSRRQVLEPRVVDLADIVNGMERMLRRLIGADVDLTTSGAPGAAKVLVDPGQIEQVIMNLAVNARDAMPEGGQLTIETAQVVLDQHYASEHVGVTAGPHIMLAVSDTGTGMDEATQAHMFEPFFTTKEQGKGTGLGLATVFGIVQQSGGTIWVYSEPGKGTSFKLYFPVAAEGTVGRAPAPAVDRGTLRGTETILLVEDDERIRVLARSILRKQGYTVLEAQNGGEAFLLCEQYTPHIDLLLTDVVMPRMSGGQLSERLRPIRPQMRVLFMSGYTDDAIVRHGTLSATMAFIQKPITPESLARKVREVLGAPSAPPTAVET